MINIRYLKPRFGVVFLVALIFLVLPYSSFATSHTVVFVNGDPLQTEVEPVIKNGFTLVPLRGIFESLGASVNWDEKTNTINAEKGKTKIKLTINSTTAMINGKTIVLDVKAQIIQGRTMVPLRFIGEALGSKVTWQSKTHAIFISDNSNTKLLIYLTLKNGEVISTHPKYTSFDLALGEPFNIVLDKAFTDVWNFAVEGNSIPITMPTTLKNGDLIFTFNPPKSEDFKLHVIPVKYDASQGFTYLFKYDK